MVEVKIFRYRKFDLDEFQNIISQLPSNYVNGLNHKPILGMLRRRASSAKHETKKVLAPQYDAFGSAGT